MNQLPSAMASRTRSIAAVQLAVQCVLRAVPFIHIEEFFNGSLHLMSVVASSSPDTVNTAAELCYELPLGLSLLAK